MEISRYHFVGVAGVGMSAVAQAVAFMGGQVSGSDRYYDRGDTLPVLKQLKLAGIDLFPQDGSGVRNGAQAVVVSTAIEDDNPDLVAARQAGIPVLHRSEVLAKLVADRRCLAVAGTSGKSTVTGMTGWILECAGLNPSVVNGAPLANWQSESSIGNFRGGDNSLWVIEADESDRSLLNYRPEFAVITNMSADHFDLDETIELFREFATRVRGEIIGVLQGSPYLNGITPDVRADACSFDYEGVRFELKLPGKHNIEDALHAVELCRLVGVSVADAADALRDFRGIHRRLEVIGRVNGVTVIDDYGHNPAKIAAAWRAVVPFARRGIVVWRPHGYGPLRSMLEDLTATFTELAGEKDAILLLPVYDVGGTARRDINSDKLAESLRKRGVDVSCVATYDACVASIKDKALSGDAVIVMGARDPELPELARRIVAALSEY